MLQLLLMLRVTLSDLAVLAGGLKQVLLLVLHLCKFLSLLTGKSAEVNHHDTNKTRLVGLYKNMKKICSTV